MVIRCEGGSESDGQVDDHLEKRNERSNFGLGQTDWNGTSGGTDGAVARRHEMKTVVLVMKMKGS